MSHLPLPTDRVDLWLCSWPDCDDALTERYRRLLSEDERARGERFVFEPDRRRHLVTRALVRTVLSRYAATLPADWRFTTNANGRPQIADDREFERELAFNVSHAGALILLGVARRTAIGVDVEEVRAVPEAARIAERFFSRAELVGLQAESEPARAERFFEYWTLKESYIKARGEGLSLALDSFSFDLAGNKITLTVGSSLNDEPTQWQFWQFRPMPNYVGAVCVRTEAAARRPLLRRVIPLRDEQPLEWCPLRQS